MVKVEAAGFYSNTLVPLTKVFSGLLEE